MCREPLTVGGGVSIEKISARSWLRSNRYVAFSSQTTDHRCSRPSSDGLSGIWDMGPIVGGAFLPTPVRAGRYSPLLVSRDAAVVSETAPAPATWSPPPAPAS